MKLEEPRLCVLTIQGGGALAVELVGQLKGITGQRVTRAGQPGNLGFDIAGVAGASAGAIIATLFWAGYKPDDIVRNMVGLFTHQSEDFFGSSAGDRFNNFDNFQHWFLKTRKKLLKMKSDYNQPIKRPLWFYKFCRTVNFLHSLKNFYRTFSHHLEPAFNSRGLFAGDGFEKMIDDLLKRAPHLADDLATVSGRLTFGHVRKLCLPPLFLIVTDVQRQTMLLVNSVDPAWDHVEIARAVRASSGFPGFFQPVALDEGHPVCGDGGMISNVPGWVFDSNYRALLLSAAQAVTDNIAMASWLTRLAAKPWHHVYLRLDADQPETAMPDGGLPYVTSLARIFAGAGRRELEDRMSKLVAAKRVIVRPAIPGAARGANPTCCLEISADQRGSAPDCCRHRVRRPADVLDFTALSDQKLVNCCFEFGRNTAIAAFHDRLPEPPPAADVAAVLAELGDRIEAALGPLLRPGSRVRLNIFQPKTVRGEFYDSDPLAMTHIHNMDGHPDINLVVEAARSVTGLCYQIPAPVLANLRDKLLNWEMPDPEFSQPFATTATGERTWLLSVPVLDPLDVRPKPFDWSWGLSMDEDGPVLATLNADAVIDFEAVGLDPNPVAQEDHPVVKLAFDAMLVASRQIGRLFNHQWLKEI